MWLFIVHSCESGTGSHTKDLQIVCYIGHVARDCESGNGCVLTCRLCGYVPAHSCESGIGPSERTAALVFDFSVDGLDQIYAPGPNCDCGAVCSAHNCQGGKGEGTQTCRLCGYL